MFRHLLFSLAAFGIALAGYAVSTDLAAAQEGCPEGSYSVTATAEGSILSVLFDEFVVSADGSKRKTCDLSIPLNLPVGQSLGVYRIDYRGFAHLDRKQQADLTVVHFLGADRKGHRFHRKVRGVLDADFAFTESIGAGLMKRVGCGNEAVLNVSISLALDGASASEAMATLDSADGAPKGGVTYYLDTKKCPK